MLFKQEIKKQIDFLKDHFSSYIKDALGRVIGKPVRRLYSIVVRGCGPHGIPRISATVFWIGLTSMKSIY